MPQYDAEFAEAIASFLPLLQNAPKPAIGDFETRRKGLDLAWAGFMEAWPAVDDVEPQIHILRADDGAEILIHRFSKTVATDVSNSIATAAVLYCHGGGYFSLSAELYGKVMATYASGSGAQIFGVEYRMAPEHGFPVPLQDCWQALQWVHQNARELGIDPARIAVMGDSAGGGLAAGLAIMARDHALAPPIAKQLLVAAMLDNQNRSIAAEVSLLATWSVDDNITGWQCYIGQDANPSCYAVSAKVAEVEGLPPTYIDVSDLDIFRDENLAYGSRIAAANIPVEMVLYPGLPHCFDILAPRTSAAESARADRIRALRTI
jgi:acetyl esterase/lipase